VGFNYKSQKKETKRKNAKERKRKRSLILSFQIFINDYSGRGAKDEGLKHQNVECKMSAFA
jgi:hypothetical protein